MGILAAGLFFDAKRADVVVFMVPKTRRGCVDVPNLPCALGDPFPGMITAGT